MAQAALVRQWQPLWHWCTWPHRKSKDHSTQPFHTAYRFSRRLNNTSSAGKYQHPGQNSTSLLKLDFPWLAHAIPRDFQRYLGTTLNPQQWGLIFRDNQALNLEAGSISRWGKQWEGVAVTPSNMDPRSSWSVRRVEKHIGTIMYLATTRNNGLTICYSQTFWESTAFIRTSAQKNINTHRIFPWISGMSPPPNPQSAYGPQIQTLAQYQADRQRPWSSLTSQFPKHVWPDLQWCLRTILILRDHSMD